MEIPVLSSCGHWNLIDPESLTKRPFAGLYTVSGYPCRICGIWEAFWYSNLQLDDQMRRLNEMRPTHPSFWYHFVKAKNRAQEIQKRGRGLNKGENGTVGHSHMVKS
jgi:hypothetical protein